MKNLKNYYTEFEAKKSKLIVKSVGRRWGSLLNDSMKQTVKFIHNLSGQGTYAIIDPISYRNFNITQVPTIVLISDDHQCQYGKCTQTPRHDRISGNITLNYALRQFKTNGDFKQEANRYLSALQTREVGR